MSLADLTKNLRAEMHSEFNPKPKAKVHSVEWAKIMAGEPVEINPTLGAPARRPGARQPRAACRPPAPPAQAPHFTAPRPAAATQQPSATALPGSPAQAPSPAPSARTPHNPHPTRQALATRS